MGIRGVLGETVIGQKTCDSEEPYGGLGLAEAFIKEWKGHELVTPIIAPHATNTNSPQMLKKAYDIAEKYDTLCTLHASEMDYELTYFQEKYGRTPIEFLEATGVLGSRLLAAHCIHLTKEDIRLLAAGRVSVSHCIGSNTKAAKGVAPVALLRSLGVNVGLGTDGPASGNTLDLFTQMRMCENFHKNTLKDRSAFPAKEIVKMATIEGAKALGLGDVTGSLEPGKEADLVIIETDSPNMFPIYDPYSTLVYSAFASNVRDVYVAGECLVEEKRLVKEDLMDVRMALKEKMERTKFKEMKALT